MTDPIILGGGKVPDMAEQIARRDAAIRARAVELAEQTAIALYSQAASKWLASDSLPPVEEVRRIAQRAVWLSPFVASAIGYPIEIKERQDGKAAE